MRNRRTRDHVLRKWRWRIRGESVRFAEQHCKFSEESVHEGIGLEKHRQRRRKRRRRRNKVDFSWGRRGLNLFICDSSICTV